MNKKQPERGAEEAPTWSPKKYGTATQAAANASIVPRLREVASTILRHVLLVLYRYAMPHSLLLPGHAICEPASLPEGGVGRGQLAGAVQAALDGGRD
jgi:hypothetical protein